MTKRALILTAAIFCFSLIAEAATVLYLKDGTTIEVVRYEVKGRLIRYLDPISRRWEEMPAELVDLPRTASLNQSKAIPVENNPVELKKGKAVSLGPSARERGFEVAEGHYVPNQEGFYVFTGSKVLSLSRSETTVSQNKARKILNVATIPVFANQSEVKLPGERSSVRLPSGLQTFYVRLEESENVEVELLRLEARSGKRVASRVSQGAVTGRASKQSRTLTLKKEQVEETLLRVFVDSLPPGEYAFWLRPSDVELKKGQVLAEAGLWDFGID